MIAQLSHAHYPFFIETKCTDTNGYKCLDLTDTRWFKMLFFLDCKMLSYSPQASAGNHIYQEPKPIRLPAVSEARK